MKTLMENFNKFVNEEELEAMQEQEPRGLSGTYDFLIRDDRDDFAYITNVPVSMLDTSSYDSASPDYVDPARLLRLTPEAFEKIMGRNRTGYFYDMRVKKIPKTVQVEATFDLRTGKLLKARVPKVIDAGAM